MTRSTPPDIPPDAPPKGGTASGGNRIQTKADILESNLFNHIQKQANPVVLQFQINRETSPDSVIIKALLQLFPRINVKAPKILLIIRKLLAQDLPRGEELKIRKKLLSLADQNIENMGHLEIWLRAVASATRLAVEIKGVAAIPSKDAEVGKAYFDYEKYPGIIHEDGTIDFREINKYPIVKAGDKLFYITPEAQGKPGIQYDGQIIPVSQAQPMNITLKEGVEIAHSLDKEGTGKGHFIRATKTGAVLLTHREGQIAEIDIQDALDVKRLDYATGNIGTQFICPVSMKVDTICNGFKIRARGTIEAGEVEGGQVSTDSNALIHTAHPQSSITAKKDIVIHFSRHAAVSSETGQITIVEEAVDSSLEAPQIFFDKYKGILSGNSLDSEDICLKNIYFSGQNTIYFGRRLFRQRNDLILARDNLKKEVDHAKEEEDAMRRRLHQSIRDLSRILKSNPLLRGNLKTFLLAAQSMAFPVLFQELNTIAQTMNTKEVDHIRKCLTTLEQLPQLDLQARDNDKALGKKILEKEDQMTRMTLDIQGFLRRTASLQIFIPESERQEPDQPILQIESQQEKNTPIQIQGSYSRTHGFIVNRL